MVVCGTKSKQSLCEPSCNGNIPAASPSPMNKNQAETAKCACTPLRCATMICFWIKKSKILCPLRYYPYICQQIKNSSMPRYINPFCDVGFKRIFGQEYSKPLLISFLNNLLKGEKEITDLTF